MSAPPVTVLCVTRGARDAVRLTMASLASHTPERPRVIVGDTGSSDGTVEYLDGLPGIELHRLPTGLPHGRALDRLTGLVETEYLLTLDSDMELLEAGWLSGLLDWAAEYGLDALGELEPAIGGYRARLAPHALLLRTRVLRELGLTFAGFTEVADLGEAARFRGRHGSSFRLTRAEAAALPSARYYGPGALAFERLCARGRPWGETPAELRRRYRHFGHMSWAGDDPLFAEGHRRNTDEIRARLAAY